MTRKPNRAAHGSGTIRKRPDGRWEARVTMGRDPLTGKHIRKSVYGQTEQEVRKKLTQIAAAVDDGTYTEPSKLTVGQWLDIWTSEYLGGVKPRTVDSYKAICRVHLKPALGDVKLSALSAHTIQTLFNHLQREKGLSPKTVNNIHGVLHKALQQAVELTYIRFNPANACKLPRIEKPEISPLDDEAIIAFLDALQGHRWEAVYLVTLFTGMRQGEVLGLSWSCLDFTSGTILINKQLQLKRDGSGEYALVTPKNNKSRRITPAPSVMEVLREQRRRQSEWRFRAGSAWEDSDLVFTDELGHNLSSQTVYKNFKAIVRAIGIPESRFHDLRHSYAVNALQAGDDIKTLQENLGHHTASFTLDTYGHVTEKMKQESANRMEQFIKNHRVK